VAEKPTLEFRMRGMLSGLTRLVILFGVGLPYVMATVLTYRPKVELRDDPLKQLGFHFEPVSFSATDGTPLSGWWIPAEDSRGRPRANRSGENTVLICHGLASNKSNQLVLARGFVPYGYNVLIFDFRAHGASGGQLTSFGDLERRDVLGAVRWIRAHHAGQARHIYGVGASMGAAALIAAAADRSPEGQAIDAIAAYGTYDSVRAELQFVAEDRFVPPLRFVIERLGLPLASAQVGADLNSFSPATLVHDLWPRPIMVIHGLNDQIIAFNRGQRLFDSAQQPKRRLWVDKAGHNDIINDDNVAQRVREFFQNAKPVPVI
ncbi:MAG TPA: alpha/beta hydrolase, partial [Candidatus Binataceae bacterium]|nr:alpha/beta hydrolase [Candidatus Binataceae bacterium]